MAIHLHHILLCSDFRDERNLLLIFGEVLNTDLGLGRKGEVRRLWVISLAV